MSIMDCVWSLLTATDGAHAWVWDVNQHDASALQDYEPLTKSIGSKFQAMDFSHDGSLLASCINSKASIFLSKIGRDDIITHENPTKHCYTAVKFPCLANRFLALGSSNNKVYMYDLKTKTTKFDFSGFSNGSNITALQFYFNDNHITSGDSNGNVAFHSCTNGTSTPIFSYPSDMAIEKLKYSGTKKQLLISGHESGAVTISDMMAKKTIRTFAEVHSSPVVSLITPSLMPSPMVISIGLDKKLVFYDVGTSKITHRHELTHHAASCEFNACERILAIGTNDGVIKFYDIRNFSKCFKEIPTFVNTKISNLTFQKSPQDLQLALQKRKLAPSLEPKYIIPVSEEKVMNGKFGNTLKRNCFNMSSDSDGLYSPIRLDVSLNRKSVSRSKSVDDLTDSSFNKSLSPNFSPKISLRCSLSNSTYIPTTSSPRVVIPQRIVDDIDDMNSREQITDSMNSKVPIMDSTNSKEQVMDCTNPREQVIDSTNSQELKIPNANFPICGNMDEQSYWNKMKSLISEVLKEKQERGHRSMTCTCVNASDSFSYLKGKDSVFPEPILLKDNPASVEAILEQSQVSSIFQAIENVSTSVDHLRQLTWSLHTGLIKCMNQDQSECIKHLNDLHSEIKNDINELKVRVGSRKCKYCHCEYTTGI